MDRNDDVANLFYSISKQNNYITKEKNFKRENIRKVSMKIRHSRNSPTQLFSYFINNQIQNLSKIRTNQEIK